MSSELDANKIAAEVISKALSETTKALTSTVREFFKRVHDSYSRTLRPYLTTTIDRCCHVKTPVINRDRPTYLFDIYVHTQIKAHGKTLRDDDFIPLLVGMKSAVISGFAGSGKSMFMRYLFVSMCEKGFGRIPLFIELRNLNSFAIKDLQAFIFYSVVGSGAVLTREQFDEGLRHGTFSIILDGFDEVDVDQRKSIERQILELREKYPEIVLIISSRPDPDNRFQSWSRFHVCQVCPMDQVQTTELIKKIDYDVDTKRKFLKQLKESLFKTHNSFLSNPLLCIMMLITFKQTGHIPDKMHIFYEQAFDALFFLHDAAKEGVYKRKTYADLPIDEFRNCLSAFCIVSYIKERFSFTSAELREDIAQALQLEKKVIDIPNLISDLVESTCLLQIEGTEYSFTHRSFQEYFAACYIVRSPAAGIPAMLDQFSRRREDDLVRMAFAMNRSLLEREWIIPRLTEFMHLSSQVDPDLSPIEYVERIFGPLDLWYRNGVPGEFAYSHISSLGSVLSVIADLYGDEFAATNKWTARQVNSDKKKIKVALEGMESGGDPRVIANIKRGNRKQSGTIRINKSDENWLRTTRIPGYFSRHKKVVAKLLRSIESDISNQRSFLVSLLNVERSPG